MEQYPNYGGPQEPPSTYGGYQQYNDPYSQSGYVAPANPSSDYYYGNDNPPPPSSSSTFNNDSKNSDGNDKYNSDNSILHTSNDTIYISNLSKDVTETNLAEYFGGLGMLKIDKRTQKPKIWIYYDKITGVPKGDATITYEDPDSTIAAIKNFDNQPFLGQIIKVEMSVRKISATGFNKPGGGGRGGGGFRNRGRGGGGGGGGFQSRGRGGPPARDGDWACDSCNESNFARRMECYKCHEPRSNAPGGNNGGTRYGSSSSSSPSTNRGGYKGRRGGSSSNSSSSSYDQGQGYGRYGKQDDRQDRRDRHRPY